MIITFPGTMTLRDWADQVVLDLDSFGALTRLQDQVHWQAWAAQFLNNVSIGRNLPNPYGFSDWAEWAERFCGALS